MDWVILLVIAIVAGVLVLLKDFFYLVFWNIIMNAEIIIYKLFGRG